MNHLYKNVYVEESLVYELLTAMFRVQCHEYLIPSDPKKMELVPKDLISWVEKTRKLIPESYRKDLEIFFNYESYLGMLLVPGCWQWKEYKSVDSFLEYMANFPSEDIIKGFFCTGFSEVLDIYSTVKKMTAPNDILNFIKGRNLPEEEKWKLFFMLYDADHTKKRLIDLIRYFYENFFKDHIEFLINHQRESIQALEKELEVNTEDKLNKLLGVSISDYQSTKEIVLFPSYYYNTSSLSSYYEDISSFIYVFGTMQLEYHFSKNKKLNDQQLIDSIKALSDENRMKIIRILNHAPCYGYELGQKLGVSNSTISHHLSLLTTLELISSYRDENKIYYEVNKGKIKEILENFSEFLT